MRDIPYYTDYISDAFFARLLRESKPVAGVEGLRQIGESGGLESADSLKFVCELYETVKKDLDLVLRQRARDRAFFDERTAACFELNQNLKIDFLDPAYETVLGHEDGRGRIVAGPLNDHYCRPGGGNAIAPLPDFLKGSHVTLFGPPDDPKLSINAMNAIHRKLKSEPAIVSELVDGGNEIPKWGADDEDSKTPLRADLISAFDNLSRCMHGDLTYIDPKTKKAYGIESERRSLPIKRFPGLALPSVFLFYKENPLPLHLYDFALHFFRHWNDPKAISFYVPKLETSEEARYIRLMVEAAEKMIQARHPSYRTGTIRLFIVLENPRAIFRTNEIMNELHPYFAGASLGWHDYLASTARMFKNDANYRIPVKADPDIVIKYIKASHELLAHVVGPRGGIKIGGMYGVLPLDNDPLSSSFQLTIKGFIKDVVTQLKRNLSGFWVAHPDFVRIGLALVEAWKRREKGDSSSLEKLATSLLEPAHHDEILKFIRNPDIAGLNPDDPRHKRALIVADIKASNFIANNDPDEIRYNVFQSLQYLADWLSGNGCVALPAQIGGVPVRVMDDLATAERSRWEVWHEIRHGRFALERFLQIAHEEMTFIRKDRSNDKKIVQVKWDSRTEKWYPLAFNLMILLMTSPEPAEFATELLMPFTALSIRDSKDPWREIQTIDSKKYRLEPYVQRFNKYFSACGHIGFAAELAKHPIADFDVGRRFVRNLDLRSCIEAAKFHGDIGENKKTLDHTASAEQARVLNENDEARERLRELGERYLNKFGIKFLISAKGKSAAEIEVELHKRIGNTPAEELENARAALWEIAHKRLHEENGGEVKAAIAARLAHHQIIGAQIAVASRGARQTICFGDAIDARAGVSNLPVTERTMFELASLSKTVATAFAIEYFASKKISLETPVNELLEKSGSKFRLKGELGGRVRLTHLMNHSALNLHYVNGVPAGRPMPNVAELLEGNATYGYEPIRAIHEPGTVFQYSGGGFLVLEHLIESLEKNGIQSVTGDFLRRLGLGALTFDQSKSQGREEANGYLAGGREVEGGRKMFPAFAAGALGTAEAMTSFLSSLTRAYHGFDSPISHDTAVQMLFGTDLGSRDFMGANMGLGVFTLEGGPNRFAIHQGANDGFRCLFIYCYDGPNRDSGFTILCNGDENGVRFVAETAQILLREMGFAGVDTSLFSARFESAGLAPEQIVNRGYEELIFKAFQPDLADEIIAKGPRDPLASYNLAVGSRVVSVTDQKFARAENLVSEYQPVFEPELYGRQGKIMDSWESVRHNPRDSDQLILALKGPSKIHYVSFSTKYHFGNQPQYVKLEGRSGEKGKWRELVPKTPLEGHALKRILSADSATAFDFVKVSMYPDGGLTRMGLYGPDLPASERPHFKEAGAALNIRFEEKIPHSERPLTPKYSATPETIAKNWARLTTGEEVDVASQAYGGKTVSASNEHYGPAAQVISPYPPLNMFDGFESARSREPGHKEELVVELGRPSKVDRIEIDFRYFKNNNPRDLEVTGLAANGTWIALAPKTFVKPYAGNSIRFEPKAGESIVRVKITVYPDGGMNRLRVFTKV